MDVESSIMTVMTVITKAMQQQTRTCLFPSFKPTHLKKEIAMFLGRRKAF